MENNYPYAEIWASITGMEAVHAASIKSQLLARVLSGVALNGVSDILDGAPVEFKVEAWTKWAEQADVSGYHLRDILALGTTETAECVYPIVSRWAHTAKLSKYSAEEISKMGKALTNHDDYAAMWQNWARTADFRKYRIMDIAKLMYETTDDSAAKVIGLRWFEQVGTRGERELKALGAKDVDKINGFCLPQDVINVWNGARS